MASYYTKSKVPRTSEIEPSECSDVEPGDAAPSAAATSPLPLSTIVRPTVASAEESESMAPEPAEPVSAHPSSAGRPTSMGGPGVEGPEDSVVRVVPPLCRCALPLACVHCRRLCFHRHMGWNSRSLFIIERGELLRSVFCVAAC